MYFIIYYISFGLFLTLSIITYPVLKGIWGMERTLVVLLFVHSFGSALIQFYNAYVALYYDYKKFLKLSIFNVALNIILSILLILAFSDRNKYIGRILGTAIPVIIIGIYVINFFFRKAKARANRQYVMTSGL